MLKEKIKQLNRDSSFVKTLAFILAMALILTWTFFVMGLLTGNRLGATYESITVEKGNISSRVKGIGTLTEVANGQLAVQIDIYATGVDKVQKGQFAELTAEGSLDQIYYGIIDNVDKEGVIKSGIKVYPVSIITEANTVLNAGVKVSVNILAKKDVLRLPVKAIINSDLVLVSDKGETIKGKEVVEQSGTPNGYHYIKITVGEKDSQYAEIVSGLNEGDEVVIASDAGGFVTLHST